MYLLINIVMTLIWFFNFFFALYILSVLKNIKEKNCLLDNKKFQSSFFFLFPLIIFSVFIFTDLITQTFHSYLFKQLINLSSTVLFTFYLFKLKNSIIKVKLK